MLFVWGICGTNKKKSERGHHRIDEELTFKEGFSTTRSHLLCSPVQGPLCSSVILKLEYLGRVFGEILIWIPQAGMESTSLCSGIVWEQKHPWGCRACQYLGGYHRDGDCLEKKDKA